LRGHSLSFLRPSIGSALLLLACSRKGTGLGDPPPTPSTSSGAEPSVNDSGCDALAAAMRMEEPPPADVSFGAGSKPPMVARARDPFRIVFPSDASWAATCVARRGCPPKETLPVCEAPGIEWSPDAPLNAHVKLRGRLVVTSVMSRTLVRCIDTGKARSCCNSTSSPMVLDSGGALLGFGMRCGGDDSGECCPLPADGRSVVVEGTLEDSAGALLSPRLHIKDARICRSPTSTAPVANTSSAEPRALPARGARDAAPE
jgi:hypothetical protein